MVGSIESNNCSTRIRNKKPAGLERVYINAKHPIIELNSIGVKMLSNAQYNDLSGLDKALVKAIKRDEMLDYRLKQRLLEWGIWRRKEIDNQIGYSSHCAMFALAGSRRTGVSHGLDNPRAEEVDRAYNNLKNKRKSHALVLRAEYVDCETENCPKTGRKIPEKQKTRAKRLGLDINSYARMLKEAVYFVEGQIA